MMGPVDRYRKIRTRTSETISPLMSKDSNKVPWPG